MKRKVCLIFYYGFARYLPVSYSFFGGSISKKIRYVLCKNIFKKCGLNVNVERLAFFGNGSSVEIGNNSGIGINAHILNNTIIGNDVMMGPNCYMLLSTHKFDRIDIPMIKQGKTSGVYNKIIIEDDVWIGRDVMIVGNRVIKKGTIIGARCVLTKDFPELSILGGNPSKLIRSRI